MIIDEDEFKNNKPSTRIDVGLERIMIRQNSIFDAMEYMGYDEEETIELETRLKHMYEMYSNSFKKPLMSDKQIASIAQSMRPV